MLRGTTGRLFLNESAGVGSVMRLCPVTNGSVVSYRDKRGDLQMEL
jgi:hypothetical protein